MKEFIYSKYYERSSNQDDMDDLPFERRENKWDFMEKLKRFADDWSVDVDVFEEGEQLEIRLYFKERRFKGIYKLELDRIAAQCDAVCIPSRKHRSCALELQLFWK